MALNISEVVTTTISKRSKKLADGVSKNNAILTRLNEKGRVKPVDGGDVILQELSYAQNSTAMWYDGFETLNIQPSETLTSASFNWKQLAAAVIISGKEELQNAGEERMISLITSRIENAEKTLANLISQGMYADGTGTGGKELGGLQLLVADTPTSGSVGGISRTDYSWWQNQTYDASTDGGSAASATNIQKFMNAAWMEVVRGADKPDLILADNNYYGFYLNSLQLIQQITSDKMASAGFTSLKYMGADVVLDGGLGGFCPANHMYFLNSDYIFYRPHKSRNMVPLDGKRFATNQDASVTLIGFMGNMTASNCSVQSVLKA